MRIDRSDLHARTLIVCDACILVICMIKSLSPFSHHHDRFDLAGSGDNILYLFLQVRFSLWIVCYSVCNMYHIHDPSSTLFWLARLMTKLTVLMCDLVC